jgi:phosphatidylserine/phosphatidylglycerophosphate/cardiolipin synthase-like enzyme
MNEKTKLEEKRGVYLLQTTKVGIDRPGWEDQTSLDRIKSRLRRIMIGLPEFNESTIIYTDSQARIEAKVDAALKNLHLKRVLGDNGKMYSHSKIVCVDRKLMYVGSDNAYPCYNEEHGIWVEEPGKVGSWVKDFFDTYWLNSTDPGPENDWFAKKDYHFPRVRT